MVRNTEFTIVDFETTGLFPEGHDRIIEIGAIRIDSSGRVLDEFETLVNPKRDIGPTSLHGISARDVLNAPAFEEIAGDMIAILSGAVFVSHNAPFDMRFLNYELRRCLSCPIPEYPYLCTINLIRKADPDIPSVRLTDLCAYYGIPHDRAHSAYSDAKAATGLFKISVTLLGGAQQLSLDDIGVYGSISADLKWPEVPVNKRYYHRENALEDSNQEGSYLSRLVSRLPIASRCSEVEDYLLLVERVLEDRRITQEESVALFALASALGLSKEQAITSHHEYLRNLIRVALLDGEITETEQKDLDHVRMLLDVSPDRYGQILDEAQQERASHMPDSVQSSRHHEIIGKSICFTGELQCQIDGSPVPRSLAQKIAQERGMEIKKNVSKGLDYLVVADPYSQSGKAKKAREYGTKIIAEPVFWQMMSIKTD